MKRQRNTIQTRKGEQNLFRTIQAGRGNRIFENITDFFFSLSSYPSYIVEVFLRKKFGERYFTTTHAILISIVMLGIWFAIGKQGREIIGFTWLIFIAAFLVQAIRHRLEMKKYGTAYNFDRFSYSDGEILPFWWKIIDTKVFGIIITRYKVLIYLEPAIPIILGLHFSLIPFTRGVGILLFISGLLFSFRSFMKAQRARNMVLDMIDEKIVMEAKHDVLVEEKPMSETKGISFPIELPKSRELREELSNSMDNHNPLDIWDSEASA